MLVVVCASLMLLTIFCLMVALVYNSTLRNLITMVDEDFIHTHYEYDAFVSYNFNDSDWVLNKLVPSLEELPDSGSNHHNTNGSQSSKIHFSSIYQAENEQYNLRTWIRNNKNKKSALKIQQEKKSHKEDYCRQINQPNCPHHPHHHHQPSQVMDDKNQQQQQQNRIKLCVYERDFIAGKQISDCITESIRNSRKVILVVSKNFAQSAWCRFETDLAHHVLVDQNRDGLILIKLEDLSSDFLEKTAPQLHFLLKTRIYLQWSQDKKEQHVFWKKLHSALGFNKTNNGTYNQIRNMYQNYCTNKPDLKRRHSVVLATTQNELNNVYTEKKDVNNNNLLEGRLNDEGDENAANKVMVKEENILQEQQKQPERISVPMAMSAKEENNGNDIEIQKNLDSRKLDDRIELRNLNQFLSTYDNLPFYRLMFTTQNLLPHLFDKVVLFKRLVINHLSAVLFGGFSFRS